MAEKQQLRVLAGSWPEQIAYVEQHSGAAWLIKVKPPGSSSPTRLETVFLDHSLEQLEVVDLSKVGSTDKAILGGIVGGALGDMFGPRMGTAGMLLGASAGLSGTVRVAMGFRDGRSMLADIPEGVAGQIRPIVHGTVTPDALLKSALLSNGIEGPRQCPFCAETIMEAAVVCRFCQKDLPTAARQQSDCSVQPAPNSSAPIPRLGNLPAFTSALVERELRCLPDIIEPGGRVLACVSAQRGNGPRTRLLVLTKQELLVVHKTKSKPAEVETFPFGTILRWEHNSSLLGSRILLQMATGPVTLKTTNKKDTAEFISELRTQLGDRETSDGPAHSEQSIEKESRKISGSAHDVIPGTNQPSSSTRTLIRRFVLIPIAISLLIFLAPLGVGLLWWKKLFSVRTRIIASIASLAFFAFALTLDGPDGALSPGARTPIENVKFSAPKPPTVAIEQDDADSEPFVKAGTRTTKLGAKVIKATKNRLDIEVQTNLPKGAHIGLDLYFPFVLDERGPGSRGRIETVQTCYSEIRLQITERKMRLTVRCDQDQVRSAVYANAGDIVTSIVSYPKSAVLSLAFYPDWGLEQLRKHGRNPGSWTQVDFEIPVPIKFHR